PGAANGFLVTGPVRVAAASSFAVTVTAFDPYGNMVTGYVGTVRFTSSDGRATLPARYTFTAGDRRVHTVTVTLRTAGTQSIRVSDVVNLNLSGSITGIAVRPRNVLLSAPVSVPVGNSFPLTLTVQSADGSVATGYNGSVRIVTSIPGLLPTSCTFTAADRGI